jgi:hypothetical protein
MVAEWSGRELCTLARMLGSCVRIPLQAWIFSVVCVFLCLCTCRDLATSCSHAQVVMPTVLDLVTEVKRKVSWRRPRPKLGCRASGKKKKNLNCNKIKLETLGLHISMWRRGRAQESISVTICKMSKNVSILSSHFAARLIDTFFAPWRSFSRGKDEDEGISKFRYHHALRQILKISNWEETLNY